MLLSKLRFIGLISLLGMVSCAALPNAQYDNLRAIDKGTEADHIALLRHEGEEISGTHFVSGNKVTLLTDGAATYPAMLAAIRGAQKRIDMESFLFDEGEGKQFARALIQRRMAGVEVNLIYDSFGSIDTPSEMFDRMEEAGIHLVEYNPIDPVSVIDTSANHRDHRKLLLIDGKTAFVGGVNISAVYKLKLKVKNALHIHNKDQDIEKLPWRDTHLKISGPVVAEFEKFFMETWNEQDGGPISDPPPTPRAKQGDILVQAIDGTPDMDKFSIYRSLLMSIALAHTSIHLTTGFFVPTPDLVDALQNAAKRGVDVTLILPSHSDSDLALKAGHASYEDLMEAGVKIYEFQDAVLHAKTAVIDGLWSTVGSSNLDWRSVVLNDECNAVVLDKGFSDDLEKLFQQDIKHSKYIDSAVWSERPWWEVLDEWKARAVEVML